MDKRILLALVILIGASGFIWSITRQEKQDDVFGAVQTVAEKVEQNNAKQATFKQANGRYKQCPPEQIGSALVWCTEYVNSKGAGYQNIIKIDTATSTIIKSFVFGATEGEEWRILDLILVKPEETATITAQRL